MSLNKANWSELLEPGLRKIHDDRHKMLVSQIPVLFSMQESEKSVEHDLSAGALGEVGEFTGQVSYDDMSQGFKVNATHKEFAKGLKIERALVDDDQYSTINKRPAALATAGARRREKDGAGIFNNAFTTVNVGGDALALCSTAHTNAAGGSASTQSNSGVLSLTPANVEATRRLMMLFKDDQDNLIQTMPDLLLVPRALEESAFEIINSKGKVDTANNNANFHFGKYKLVVWDYLTDANNWFFIDATFMKDMLIWFDRVKPEFNRDRDFDTLVAKYMTYFRYSQMFNDWRFVYGQNVA